MDLNLIDAKSVFVSNGILSFSTSNFFTPSSFKVSPLLCSYNNKGGVSQPQEQAACCLSISQGAAAITLVGQANYDYSYRFDGSNPPSSNSSSSSIFFREKRLLDGFDDEYGGVVVNPDKLPFDTNVFASILRSSLSIWRREGKKGIWLKLPLEKCDLVPIAVREGFQYHHAEVGYVMMTYWVPNEPCMLPANASHQVGVGGFVMNDKNEVPKFSLIVCSKDFKI